MFLFKMTVIHKTMMQAWSEKHKLPGKQERKDLFLKNLRLKLKFEQQLSLPLPAFKAVCMTEPGAVRPGFASPLLIAGK